MFISCIISQNNIFIKIMYLLTRLIVNPSIARPLAFNLILKLAKLINVQWQNSTLFIYLFIYLFIII